jgi:hypothetical protein
MAAKQRFVRVCMTTDAAGWTLSASSASGQRVRAYARRYIDEPNVSCTRTPIDARMPNGRPAPARASTDKSTRAICSELFESTQVAHCASTAGTERRKGPLRMRPCRKHHQVRRPGWKCGAVVVHLSGMGRGEVQRHLVQDSIATLRVRKHHVD